MTTSLFTSLLLPASQPNAYSSIKDILNSVLADARRLQAFSQDSLNDLDSTLDEVSQSLALKDEAMTVFKARVETEIDDFQRALGQQLESLQAEFEETMRGVNREIAVKENEWEQWRMKAKGCTEVMENEEKNMENSVKRYTTEVEQLRTKRTQLESRLKSRISHISTILESEFQKEKHLHEQIESALLSKIALLRAQSESELQECEKRWTEHCKEIEKVVLEMYETYWVARQE